MIFPAQKLGRFEQLFSEFVSSYLPSDEGRKHLAVYAPMRAEARESFDAIRAAADAGDDVTEAVLSKLLPYGDSTSNRSKGAWIHIAPAITADVTKWFEHAGWTQAGDWPKIAQAILRFVRRAIANPGELSGACEEFVALPYSKGFQSGMLSPILNALRPETFLLINAKSSKTIGYFAGQKTSTALDRYPETNAVGWQLIAELEPTLREHVPSGGSVADLFDLFAHWLVAVNNFDFGTVSYWKIAPGEEAKLWDQFRDGGYVAVGWDELGDISGLSHAEFATRRDERKPTQADWTATGTEQVWTFAHIQEGDRVVANRGKKQVLGIGTVVGAYFFVPDEEYRHRLPVQWDDLTVREVSQPGWQRTLVKLDRKDFDAILNAPAAPDMAGAPALFTKRTFELLAALHDDPTYATYAAHKQEFHDCLEEPFRRLFALLALQLPPEVTETLETKKKLLSRILKNDFGKGGAWDFYWGAFYPKGAQRTGGAQLFVWINERRLECGFYMGHYALEERARFASRCRQAAPELLERLKDPVSAEGIRFGSRPELDGTSGVDMGLEEWLQDPEQGDCAAYLVLDSDTVLRMSQAELVTRIADVFQTLFPLVVVATDETAVHKIFETPGPYDEDEGNPVHPLSLVAADTGLELSLLERWVRAIERKRQAILYGPPGTGKTFVGQQLANHLAGGGNGFVELIQFHPSFSYEDFVEGIRPQTRLDGSLYYDTRPGRFLEFCHEAREREGCCVLIIDEINRANLSRVLGELMYLLEYRDRDIPLASGTRFRIPENVRLIGTMNTADRSIALVDHALRRRFAFLDLRPQFEVLRRYHASTGFLAERLIDVLGKLNDAIGNADYEIGTSYFLVQDLALNIEDIWLMEIEPYLEEYFFDKPERLKEFKWDSIRSQLEL